MSRSTAPRGRILLSAALPVVLLSVFAAVAVAQESAPELVDRILVIVDEEAILLSEFEREVALYKLEARNAGVELSQDDDAIRAEVLERLVDSKLIIAAARQEEIEVSDESIAREVQANIDQLVRYYGSLARLEQELEANNMNLSDYRRRSTIQLRDQNYMRAVVNRFVRPGIEVREDEIDAWYAAHLDEIPATPDSLLLADVLVPVEPTEEVQREVQRKLGAALQALGEGRAFAEVAAEFSEGPAASRGGRVGSVKRGDLYSTSLEEAVFSMTSGETSPPVVSERGVHILRVDDVEGESRTISQIFYPLEIAEEDVERARARAAEAHDRLVAGDPFATVVAAYSQDPTSLGRGGDLGLFALTDLSPTVQENLADLGPGELTEPFITPAGFYIFLVKDRINGSRVALEDVRQEIRQAVESEKMQDALADYVTELRGRFVVDRKNQ